MVGSFAASTWPTLAEQKGNRFLHEDFFAVEQSSHWLARPLICKFQRWGLCPCPVSVPRSRQPSSTQGRL